MEVDRAEMVREIAGLEISVDLRQGENTALTRSLDDERESNRAARDEVSRLSIENARLAEGVANTDRRAEELHAHVQTLVGNLTRLPQARAATPSEEPTASAAFQQALLYRASC